MLRDVVCSHRPSQFPVPFKWYRASSSHLHPEEQSLGASLKLQHIDTSCGALRHPLEFTVIREDDQVLEQKKQYIWKHCSCSEKVIKQEKNGLNHLSHKCWLLVFFPFHSWITVKQQNWLCCSFNLSRLCSTFHHTRRVSMPGCSLKFTI